MTRLTVNQEWKCSSEHSESQQSVFMPEQIKRVNDPSSASISRMHTAQVASPQSAQMPITPRDVSFSADVNVAYQIE